MYTDMIFAINTFICTELDAQVLGYQKNFITFLLF